MQTILPPSGNTIKILGKARSAEHGLRWMHYVLAQPVEGGVLVNCTPKVGQESQRKGCRNLWEKNCSVRN